MRTRGIIAEKLHHWIYEGGMTITALLATVSVDAIFVLASAFFTCLSSVFAFLRARELTKQTKSRESRSRRKANQQKT